MNNNASTPPPPSARLSGLPSYGRGRVGTVRQFAHRLGSNEAPDAPSREVQDAVAAAFANANRYPDLRGETLGLALSKRHNLAENMVAVAAGSIVLLDQVIRAYCDPGAEIITGWRSYEAYPIIAGLSGCVLREVPLDAEHRLDPAAMRAAVSPKTRLVLICNPNNPTGTALRDDVLDALLAELPADVVVVLDEAYCDFDGDEATVRTSAAARLARHPNLIILRTFSKAWGLAGLRVGYALAHPDIIESLHAVAPPFPLPGVALAASLAALEQPEILANRINGNMRERDRLTQGAKELGLPVAESRANFIWLPVGPDAEPLQARLADAHIAARCFAGEGVRITIGSASDTDAVLAALKKSKGA